MGARWGVVVLIVAALLLMPAAAGQAQVSPDDGQFVSTDDGVLWLISAKKRYPVWPQVFDPATFDRYLLGPPISRPPTAVVNPFATTAMLQHDGKIVVASDVYPYVLLSGYRYRIEPVETTPALLEQLPIGDGVTSLQEFAARLAVEATEAAATPTARAVRPTPTPSPPDDADDPLETLMYDTWRLKSPRNGEPLAIKVLGGGWGEVRQNNSTTTIAVVVVDVLNEGSQTSSVGKSGILLVNNQGSRASMAEEWIQNLFMQRVNNQGKFQLAPIFTPIAPGGSTILGLIFDRVNRNSRSFKLESSWK